MSTIGTWFKPVVLLVGPNSTFAPHYGQLSQCEARPWLTSTRRIFCRRSAQRYLHISQLDDSTTPIAVFVMFSDSTLSRAVIYNSAYFDSGSRSYTNVSLTGLPSS